ncbi:MAG: MarR family transcriptional regulator [Acidobacteria bacterium]|jgi:DNA-binding MarR family transcriptional regulator|nr:MarR family transcriptional regulator [Acidobacteriota bacterium]
MSLFGLLRQTHIFASTVREILETKLLREVSDAPLTLAQLQLLKLMVRDGEHHLTEVAHFLGVSPPAATKNIDKLVGLGLVHRERSTDDRRATLLSASPEGQRLVEEYERKKELLVRPVAERFRPEELEQLTSLLERFAISLLERETPESGFCARCCGYVDSGCPVNWLLGDCAFQKLRGTAVKEKKGVRPS